ncbi:hypothetical protein PoB_002347900 [Plakobranchus ocellatus]|uniref:Retrotransposon gag domain-containing protein n=1 Tax=Plakobranchus ocellatus TaxID=259542 RepID=A0AAV3ZNT4_9GAST|nr:hypothetical protein PoB_002347900 [Plakobranchus ocellatus]
MSRKNRFITTCFYLQDPKGRDLFEAKQVSTEDKANPDKLWNMFEDYMVEKPKKWVQRIELQGMTQSTDETVEEFILRLRNKADNCSFSEETKQERILEQLIKGIKYPDQQKLLLSKGDTLDLKTAIEVANEWDEQI